MAARETMREWFASRLPHVTLGVAEGNDWNHYAYQAAVGNKNTLYVVLSPERQMCAVPGATEETIVRHNEMLETIARATFETIEDKALYFKVLTNGPTMPVIVLSGPSGTGKGTTYDVLKAVYGIARESIVIYNT